MSQAASRRDIVRVITARLLDEPAKRSQWLQRLAAYMVTHNMTGQVDLIINDIAHELYIQAGMLTAEVTSVRQLSEDLRASITAMLKAETAAKTINLHESLDASLLGGFTARTADAEIDASVKTKLQALAALS